MRETLSRAGWTLRNLSSGSWRKNLRGDRATARYEDINPWLQLHGRQHVEKVQVYSGEELVGEIERV